jgi:hypothetical protein
VAVLTLVLAAYAGGVFAVLRQSLMRELDRALHHDRETAEDPGRAGRPAEVNCSAASGARPSAGAPRSMPT